VIAIVSSHIPERVAFGALCEGRGWSFIEYDSVRNALRLLRRGAPRVLLIRHRLSDGYSDDIIARLREAPAAISTRIVVLVSAGVSSATEARQLALGADCVQRDPIRTEVLQEYLKKYCEASRPTMSTSGQCRADIISFAGATLRTSDRSLTLRKKLAILTPREIELAEILHQSAGEVVSYETLYSEVLGRRYRGDTSNMRVLLGKLASSANSIRIDLRNWVEVIPKSGYRYRETS